MTEYMFRSASAFDQDLGWCVDDEVSLIPTGLTDAKPEDLQAVDRRGGTCGPF